jgi:anti-sigma factor RsiW
MRCEDVRDRLPAYSGGELREAGQLEVHLASCEGCSVELARYRELAYSLRALSQRVEEPSAAFRARVVAAIPPRRLRDDVRRIAREHPREVALGSAAIGAAAIGLLWWRAARRSIPREGVLVPAG